MFVRPQDIDVHCVHVYLKPLYKIVARPVDIYIRTRQIPTNYTNLKKLGSLIFV